MSETKMSQIQNAFAQPPRNRPRRAAGDAPL